jgi:hypothetical protein
MIIQRQNILWFFGWRVTADERAVIEVSFCPRQSWPLPPRVLLSIKIDVSMIGKNEKNSQQAFWNAHFSRTTYYTHNLLLLTGSVPPNTLEKVVEKTAPTSAPWRLDGNNRSRNGFLLGSSSWVNHGGYLSCCFTTYPLTTHKQVGYM